MGMANTKNGGRAEEKITTASPNVRPKPKAAVAKRRA
jgi:hypothetical protein